jgi:hypothetical protein
MVQSACPFLVLSSSSLLQILVAMGRHRLQVIVVPNFIFSLCISFLPLFTLFLNYLKIIIKLLLKISRVDSIIIVGITLSIISIP